MKRAALCLVLALGAVGCFGGPHPIPPEVFDRDGVAEPPDVATGGTGGLQATGGAGGVAGVAGLGGFGGIGGSGGQSAPDAGGDPIISGDGGLSDASFDDDAGSPVGE